MGMFTREVEAVEYVILVAAIIVIAAGMWLLLTLLRRHVARGEMSDVAPDEVASRTLAETSAFRGPSRGESRPWLPGLE